MHSVRKESFGISWILRDLGGNDRHVFSNYERAKEELESIRLNESSKVKKKSIVIISGGREITDEKIVARAIYRSGYLDKATEVIHGNCRGVDHISSTLIQKFYPYIKVTPFNAEWDKYRKMGRLKEAGPARNQKMAEYAKKGNGKLILVWDGISSGSKSMKSKAEKAGLEIYEYIIEG
jgi:hypothetical protein